eukprot:1156475-Pelagomonas_calceolata.AAC.4
MNRGVLCTIKSKFVLHGVQGQVAGPLHVTVRCPPLGSLGLHGLRHYMLKNGAGWRRLCTVSLSFYAVCMWPPLCSNCKSAAAGAAGMDSQKGSP